MKDKFVCVFDEKTKDLLLLQNFVPIKFDEHNNIFMFCNQENTTFEFSNVECLFTNTISF